MVYRVYSIDNLLANRDFRDFRMKARLTFNFSQQKTEEPEIKGTSLPLRSHCIVQPKRILVSKKLTYKSSLFEMIRV